jgi:iron donor protein CyaY
VATATGGKFFQNRNDLGEGFRQLAGAPEYSYLLGFSPRDLKLDGSFHNLKVTLKSRTLEIQARQGYYAPKQPAAAAEQAKRGTEDAVFSPARKTVADAQQLLTQGKDPEQGIKLLKKAIKQDPQYARAHLLMGVAYSSQSNWNEAEKSFLKAVDLDHDNAPAYVGLGAIENQRKNFPAAEKYLLEAVALVPDSADAHFELGRTYFAMGRWDAADQQVAKANQLRPTDPQQHVMMGDILLRQRNAEGALKEFQEALRLDSTGPLSEPTRQMIARIEEALKDEQDFRRRAGAALEALKQSLDSADGDADFEVEEKDGALHISFEEPPAKIVVSPNAQVRQIWISALSTSYRLDWSDERNDFVLLKTGEALKALVSRLIDEQLEEGTSSLQ